MTYLLKIDITYDLLSSYHTLSILLMYRESPRRFAMRKVTIRIVPTAVQTKREYSYRRL